MRAISAKALTSNFRNSGLRNVTSGFLERVGHETISGAAHRSNILRVFGLCLDFLAQPPDVYVHRTQSHGAIAAPHLVQQSLAAEDLARVSRQKVKQLELERAQLDRRAADA